MKSKLINTGKCTILLVELPEGAKHLYITRDNWLEYKNIEGVLRHHQLYGNWKHLCPASEITEEQAGEIVDDYMWEDDVESPRYAYKDYVDGEEDAEDYWDEYPLNTAPESHESMLRSESVFWENTEGEDPCLKNDKGDMPPSCFDSCQGSCWERAGIDFDKWEEAQQNVWSKQRTHIFIKQD